MDASAAAAAAAHRRVKRAMGLLRAAASALAPELEGLDVVGEVHLAQGQRDRRELDGLLNLARDRHGELDVVILARPRSRTTPVETARPHDDNTC